MYLRRLAGISDLGENSVLNRYSDSGFAVNHRVLTQQDDFAVGHGRRRRFALDVGRPGRACQLIDDFLGRCHADIAPVDQSTDHGLEMLFRCPRGCGHAACVQGHVAFLYPLG